MQKPRRLARKAAGFFGWRIAACPRFVALCLDQRGEKRVDRRGFLVSALIALTARRHASDRAYASEPSHGCRMAAGSGKSLSRRIRSSSGREIIDAFCTSWHQTLAEEFNIKPGFCFYDDADAPNALATPDALLPDGRDGTVMLGISLLDQEIDTPQGLRSEEGAYPKILIILAHEFAHIYQFKNGMAADGPWQMEPHADFLAGWFFARVKEKLTSTDHDAYTSALLGFINEESAVEALFKRGDTLFDNPAHHGQPEFRAAMVRSGYDAKAMDAQAAFEKGKVLASMPQFSLPRPRQ